MTEPIKQLKIAQKECKTSWLGVGLQLEALLCKLLSILTTFLI